ncbi:MAG: phosphogluconate dehydrogenase (NAD(+)-dependent, decarboxylating) [Actinomycetota bacterium]
MERRRIGMVGLGRMGANLARRLLRAGHEVVAYDRDPANVAALAAEGATPAADLAGLVAALESPRAVWLMLPAAVTGVVADEVAALLGEGDVLVDGGNSSHRDDLERSARYAARGVRYVDVSTSGGVLGLERGYCLMIGGDADAVRFLDPVFRALAPGRDTAEPTPGRPADDTASQGYLHCGPSGAGHFVKMVHNGIEYALMAAYAEGLNLLAHADVGARERAADAETAPLEHPDAYRYDLDVAAIAEVWRRGSVVSSLLLDLTAAALAEDPDLAGFAGTVSDSGEGRWTLHAAIDTGVPVHVLSAAVFDRFASRGESAFANRLLSAMRARFGGHAERR